MTYSKRILIALDRLLNVIFFGRVGETLSSRAYREQWRIRPLIDAVFFLETNHCESSYYWDRDNRDFVS